MIERFYSKDYNGKFIAVCDDLSLPFWNIEMDYENPNSYPFVCYFDEYGEEKVITGKGGQAHNEMFYDFKIPSKRSDTLCGRIWFADGDVLMTVWAEDAPRTYMSNQVFEKMIQLLKINGIKLLFEGTMNETLRKWSPFGSNDGFYIYSIPVQEYISKGMSSLDDVANAYRIQEKKKNASIDSDKYAEYGGYLPYKLLRYQSDENKKTSKKMLNENILINDLPDDIKMSLLNHTTSLGNNPAIPDIFDVPFLLKITNNRLNSIKETLSEIGKIDDFEDTKIDTMLSKLINKCKKIERPFRNELENLCLNYVIDTFNIPEDSVQINVSLADKIDLAAKSIIIDPIDGDDDFQFDDIEMASNIYGEVYKRRLLNALCMGESIILSSDIDSYFDSIYKLSPELCDLYKKIIALNNYLLFTKEDIGINDKDNKLIGTVNVELGGPDRQVRITAQGEIFPVLLSETLNGLMQLFISHGLPDNRKLAEIVIGKSDFIKAEPWDMRLGPILWEIVSKSFNDITLTDLPYLLKRISCLDVDKFNFLMKEVLAKTKKGKQIMAKICSKSKKDIEYDKFTDKMNKMKLDKSIIIDEFINEDEL